MEHALPHEQLLSDDGISAVLDKRTECTSDAPAVDAHPHYLPRFPMDDPRSRAETQARRYVWGGTGCCLRLHVRRRGEEGIRKFGSWEEAADLGELQVPPVYGLERTGRAAGRGTQAAGLAGFCIALRRARR